MIETDLIQISLITASAKFNLLFNKEIEPATFVRDIESAIACVIHL